MAPPDPTPPTQSHPTPTASPTEHREVEVTLDVDADWPFPAAPALLDDAVRAAGADSVAAVVTHHLAARYLDTADLALARSRTTLRRRSGGDDAGWHVKLPGAGADERTEVRLPLERSDEGPQHVPLALTSLVLATTRGQALEPVVELRTTRHVHRVLGPAPERSVLAEVVDDDVVAEQVGPEQVGAEHVGAEQVGAEQVGAGQARSWRELEVELVDGSPELLDALVAALLAAGARASDHPSKLRRALGERLDAPVSRGAGPAALAAPAATAALTAKSSAAELLTAHLAAQRQAVLAADPLARRPGEPSGDAVADAVHDLHVALRRVRCALATARPLLVVERTEPLRAELRWLAGELGLACDAQVLRAHVLAAVRGQDEELLDDVARDRLLVRVTEAGSTGLAAARTALDSPRYLAVLAALDDLVADPPFTDGAERRADHALRARARHDHRRLADAVEAADGARDPSSHANALHEVRKAAERARYGAEVLTALPGGPTKDSRRYAAAVADVQTSLGHLQAGVVLRALLREVAAQARAAREDTFGYGRLHARVEAGAEQAEAEFEAAWRAVTRKRVRGWLGAGPSG